MQVWIGRRTEGFAVCAAKTAVCVTEITCSAAVGVQNFAGVILSLWDELQPVLSPVLSSLTPIKTDS